MVSVLAVAAAGCGGDDGGPSGDAKQEVVEHYAAGVHAAYEASLASATALDTAIDAFVADPTEETLEAAKDAWLDRPRRLRPDRGVPLLRRSDRRRGDRARGADQRLAARRGLHRLRRGRRRRRHRSTTPTTYPTIDAELITSLNEQGGEANISTGWHAIEFLLWGQDLVRRRPRGPARHRLHRRSRERRPPRARTCTVATDLLVEHLTGLVEAWAPDADNYRAEFVGARPGRGADRHHHRHRRAEPRRAGRRADERRLRGAVQEDEHSCFSDNTTADLARQRAGHPDGARPAPTPGWRGPA